MPIANCKRCGRIYNRIRRDICSDCIVQEDRAFHIIRDYLREHRDAALAEVALETSVDAELIIDMIRDGRLILRDNPNLFYECERCGNPTQVGRYCANCTKELSASLTHAAEDIRSKLQQSDRSTGGYFSK